MKIKNPEGKEAILRFRHDLADGPIVQIVQMDSFSTQDKTILALEQMVSLSAYKGQNEWEEYWKYILEILIVWSGGYNAGCKHTRLSL